MACVSSRCSWKYSDGFLVFVDISVHRYLAVNKHTAIGLIRHLPGMISYRNMGRGDPTGAAAVFRLYIPGTTDMIVQNKVS